MKFGVNTKFLVVIFIILVIITESYARPGKPRTRRKKQTESKTSPTPETTSTTTTTSTTEKTDNEIADTETFSTEDQNDFELLPSLDENSIQEQPREKNLTNKERIDQNSNEDNEILPHKDLKQVHSLEDKNPSNYIDQKLPSGLNDETRPPGVIFSQNQRHSNQDKDVVQGIFKNQAEPSSPGKNPDTRVEDPGQISKETPGASHHKSQNDLDLEDALDDTKHHKTDGNLRNHDQTSENSLDAGHPHTSQNDLNLQDALDESEHENSMPQDKTRNQHEHQDETQDNLLENYNKIPHVQEQLIVPSVYPTTKPQTPDTFFYHFDPTSTPYPDTFGELENQIHPYPYPQMNPPYPDTLGAPEHNQLYPYPNPHFGYQNYLDDFQNQLPFNSYAPQFPYHQNPYPYYQNPFSFYQNPYQDDFLSQYHPRNFYNSQTTRWQKFKNFMQKPINSLRNHFNNLSDKVKNWFSKQNNKDQDKIESKSLTLKDFANPEIVQKFLENLSRVLSNIRPRVYDSSEVVNYAKNVLKAITDSISKYISPK